jgi:hypothetical protein
MGQPQAASFVVDESTGRSMSLPFSKTAPARTRATTCGAFTARQRGSLVVRNRQLGDLIVFGRDKSNDDKPRVEDNANSCKFGRMTLPAYGGAHADWTRSHHRRRNPFAERGKSIDER